MKSFVSLKNRQEFDRVYVQKRSFANKYLILYVYPNNLPSNRLGISVSKKVGNSVVRHRVTRLVRESYRLNKEQIQIGYDLVVVARGTAKDRSYAEVESALIHLIKLHKLIKPI